MNGPTDRVAEIMAEWRRERPDVDLAPQAIFGRLHRLANHLTDELVVVYRDFGLSEGEFDVLATMRRAGAPFERTPSELAASTMVTTGAMTKRLDRLERRGLLTRRQSEIDGRGRVIALTLEGRDLIDRAFTAHLANERRLLDEALSPPEAAALERALVAWLSHYES